MFTPIAEDIWCIDQDLKLMGANLGTRMTIIRLADQSLLLYSPVRITAELKAELEKLGQVAYIIGPNPYHHLYLSSALQAFPAAQLYWVSELAQKRPDLAQQAIILQTQADPPWSAQLPGILLTSGARFQEYILFDPRSQTLISTDLLLNFTAEFRNYKPLEKLIFKMLRLDDSSKPSRVQKVLFNKSARLKKQLETVLSWDFERILITHGANIETQAKQRLRQAFAFVLD